MIVYPATDIIDGKCVRLYKGDFSKQTTYGESPIEIAKVFKSDGAEWMHLVDLDGARDPAKRQTSLVHDIIAESGLKVQTGGGVRSERDVETLIRAGATRVVVGSLAVKDKPLVKSMLKRFGAEHICIAMDVQPTEDGYAVAVSGWRESGKVMLDDLMREYIDAGLMHVLCTDISRDGTMTGCNAALYAGMEERFPSIHVQASGGVSSLDDIKGLRAAGVIIGKALYEGAFTVRQALEAAC